MVGVQTLTRTDIEREQLFDLLTNREFRQSLVIHHERTISASIDPSVVELLSICSVMQADADSDSHLCPTTFRTAAGFSIEISEPFVSICLRQLSSVWPAWTSFRELTESGRQILATRTGQQLIEPEWGERRRQIATVLLAGFTERGVEFHTMPPSFQIEVSDRPIASPLARWQALMSATAANLRHDLVQLSDAARTLLPLLDGRRDLDSLSHQTAQFEPTMKRLAHSALLLG